MRQNAGLAGNNIDMIVLMSDGNHDAANILLKISETENNWFLDFLAMDDMNIRGERILLAFCGYCGGNLEKFLTHVRARDIGMIDYINYENFKIGGRDKVVVNGASFDSDIYMSRRELLDYQKRCKKERRK